MIRGRKMIEVTDKVKLELCEKFSIDVKALSYLDGGKESSDGIVYIYFEGSQKRVFKILAIKETEQEKLKVLEVRIQFANYLGENGIQLAYPLVNKNGNLYEISLDKGYCFIAYVMNFYEGINPTNEELTDKLVYEWGKLTGKSHAITKTFKEGEERADLGYAGEVDFFENWCGDEQIKQCWREMKVYLGTLPRGINEYGFIHNDNHQRNILVNKGEIALIDFDCANRQFFMQDITVPAQGLMFDTTGGMIAPFSDKDRLKRFYDSFLNGYEIENHLDSKWLKELDTFIKYRRMLLFTCMQGWLNTEPKLKQGFIDNILNPPEFKL